MIEISEKYLPYLHQQLNEDARFCTHVKFLLRNTSYANENPISLEAFSQAYSFAWLNLDIFQKTNIEPNPLLLKTLERRLDDEYLVSCFEKIVSKKGLS